MSTDDKWVMRGPRESDPACLKSAGEVSDYIDAVGFLPLFKNSVRGFSVEEHVPSAWWWTDDPQRDPWLWRMQLASSKRFWYGKLFDHCAGFVSKKWIPCFANLRRDGYDFDSRVDEGLVRPIDRDIMRLFAEQSQLTLSDIKSGAAVKTGLEGALSRLQAQGYLCVRDFRQRVNKQGLPYGWHVSVFTEPESVWGQEYVTSRYQSSAADCLNEMLQSALRFFPDTDEAALTRLLKG